MPQTEGMEGCLGHVGDYDVWSTCTKISHDWIKQTYFHAEKFPAHGMVEDLFHSKSWCFCYLFCKLECPTQGWWWDVKTSHEPAWNTSFWGVFSRILCGPLKRKKNKQMEPRPRQKWKWHQRKQWTLMRLKPCWNSEILHDGSGLLM